MFITKYDFLAIIKLKYLNQITEFNAQKRVRAENTAISEVYSYLSGRYDTVLVFTDIPPYSAAKPYAVGDYVVYQAADYVSTLTYAIDTLVEQPQTGKLFKSLLTANNNPLTDPVAWELFEEIPIFKCTANSAGNIPTNSSFFILEDPRHQKVVSIITDIAIYDLSAALATDEIAANRVDRRDNAMDWLKMVQRQEVNPDLPQPEDGSKDEIIYGSNPKNCHHF